MSEYYKPHRTRNLYNPASKAPFKISRSKIDFFMNCPRCFYIDRRLGVGHPPGYPFNLNSAVDGLLKKEFDSYRKKKKPHPYMTEANIDAIPFSHPDLDTWRQNFKGVQFHHKKTNFILTGAVDDVWINPQKELLVVDYKATSKKEKIDKLNDTWHDAYRRQMEIYQWLLSQNGHPVSNTGYFVYCNGIQTKPHFKNRLEFDVHIIPYEGDSSWVEETVMDLHACLQGKEPPGSGGDCDYCAYRGAVEDVI